MLNFGRMYRQTGGTFVDATAMIRQNEQLLGHLSEPNTDKHIWPSQTIQKIDMAQPRWEAP